MATLPRMSRNWLLLGILATVLVGCSKSEPPAANLAVKQDGNVGTAAPTKPAAWPNDARHQPFEQATTAEPPADAFRPVDMTKAGKNVGKMYEQIVGKGGLWEQILFIDGDGKSVQYTATLKTDLGDVTIELWPDVAPNHVRSFLALAKAGYYDGLSFHAVLRHEYLNAAGAKHLYEAVEAGCPLGTGEAGYGSIGYWLKPELHDPEKNAKVIHGEGTVGAWHGAEPDTAACKFYITLSKAPWMDGSYTVFGKVTQGLDVPRRILSRPTLAAEGFPDRPREPVVIRSVLINAR
jgi:peptidyl-prolyl cis-trans isomerase B (cyclophilin B)